MKLLYIECNMGAAGDMLLSALYELLKDQKEFLLHMNSLDLGGVHFRAAAGGRANITGSHVEVADGERPQERAHVHDHVTPGSIAALIDRLNLPQDVCAHAQAVYAAIAQAEAKAHKCPVEEVHFHEVGAPDAVAEIVGVCYAMHLLAPERVVVSPVCVGTGTVCCAHGVLPVPTPATANLLVGVPTYAGDVQGELCTPTGAALLTHFADAFGPMPAMTGCSVGIGLGGKQLSETDCVRAFLGEIQGKQI